MNLLADMEHVGGLLASAARLEIMPRFHRLTTTSFQEKSSSFDVVTQADESAETFIAEGLRPAFPYAAIIGEEAAERDPNLLQALGSAELAFLIDPIDGTKNFTARLPLFGLMVAAIRRGEIVGAVIYDPVGEDWAYAVRGEGAWLQFRDDTRDVLRVAAPVAPAAMHAIAGTNFLPEPPRTTVAQNLSRIGMNFWLRCAAHEYRMSAAGHCHLLVYNRLMPWDHAAGWLLHREAGGYSAHFDGTPYHPTHLTGGLMCAPDQASWQAARDALFDE